MSSHEHSDPLRSFATTTVNNQNEHGQQAASSSYEPNRWTSPRRGTSPSTAPESDHPEAQMSRHQSATMTMASAESHQWQARRRDASGAPRSSYYFGPPPKDSAFGTPPVGVIGRDKPREIIRIERDYTGGELCQFHPTFPLELEGRISPTTFSELINDLNVLIIQANDPAWACFDNSIAVLSLYTTPWILGSKYRREMTKLNARIDDANVRELNPAGLNLLYPSRSAFLFLELEYF